MIDDSTESPPPPRGRALVFLASTMTVMAGAIVTPALPGIARAFPEEPDAAGMARLVLTVPALATLAGAPLSGWALDRFGRRPTLVAALLLFGLAGAAGAVADGFAALLAGRAVFGVAVGGIMTATTTWLGDVHEGAPRRRALGVQAACMALGGVVYLPLGGLLASFSWRLPFLVYLLGLPFALLALRGIEEPTPRPAPTGGAPPITAAPLAATGALLLVAFLVQTLFYLIPTQVGFFFAEIGRDDPRLTGLGMGALTAALATTSFLYGRLRARMSPRAVFALVFLVAGAGLGTLGLARSVPAAVLGLALAGLGFGLAMPNANALLAELAPPRLRARLVALLMAAFYLGQFFSPILAAPFVRRGGVGGSEGVLVHAALLSIALAPVFLALALLRRRPEEISA